MDLEKFRDDVYDVTERLSESLHRDDVPKLNLVRHQLIELYQRNVVKINHSVLELICAANLIARGHDVDVERQVSEILVCDVFGKNGRDDTIVEIETGFTPPEHALDTIDYYAARITSKIARYSKHCARFSLATPVMGLLPLPKIFLLPPKSRSRQDVDAARRLCNRYYRHPPIGYEDIQDAQLHSVYLINIDQGQAKELDPQSYASLTARFFERGGVSY